MKQYADAMQLMNNTTTQTLAKVGDLVERINERIEQMSEPGKARRITGKVGRNAKGDLESFEFFIKE